MAKNRTAWIVLAPIVAHTLVLGYTSYSMPRYNVEVLPIACLMIVWAGAEALRRGRQPQIS